MPVSGPMGKFAGLINLGGMAVEKVYQVAHGVDARPLNPDDYPDERVLAIKEKLGVPVERKVVTFASRLHHRSARWMWSS